MGISASRLRFSVLGLLLFVALTGLVFAVIAVPGVIRGLTESKAVRSLAFSPDGRILATQADRLRLWDVDRQTFVPGPSTASADVCDVAYSSNGATLATAAPFQHKVKLWDTRTMKDVASFEGEPFRSVAFCADGRLLAASTYSGEVLLWDTSTGRLHSRFNPGFENWFHDLAFSPTANIVAVGDSSQVYFWDVTSQQKSHLLKQDVWRGLGLAFSPDGRTLAWSSYSPDADQSSGIYPIDSDARRTWIRLWDVATATERSHLDGGHRQELSCLAFSPDGQTLASGDITGVVNLWDLPTGETRTTVRLSGWASDLAFSPDGKTLAIGIGRCKGGVWYKQGWHQCPHGEGRHEGAIVFLDVASGTWRTVVRLEHAKQD